MREEGGFGVFINWNVRQSFRVKVVTTIILTILMIGEHWLFIGARIEVHGALILVGVMGIGFHLWSLCALLNTIYHDGRKHRRKIFHRHDRMAYFKYRVEREEKKETPMTEEEWAKRHGIRTMQV